MDPLSILIGILGLSGLISGIWSGLKNNSAHVWRANAEGYKERLAQEQEKNKELVQELAEINAKLTLIERQNEAFISVLTAVSPDLVDHFRNLYLTD
ncbi:hypothetical protein [Streptomyces sp. NPDC002644]